MTSKLAIHGGRPVRETPYPAWPVSGPREEDLIRQVLFSDQWGGNHEFVAEFERLFAGLHDARYGISVANGTLALELALAAAGIGPGDEVIVPAHSFIATATAVSRVGAVPVFVDIDRESFNIDPKKVASAVGASTAAVIVVHFGGVIAEMDELTELADEHGFKIIEDAAHAHGAEWSGRRAGGMGLAGTFSFQNSKAMTAGEGGIVLTSDHELAAMARSLGNGGRRAGKGWFEHYELGSNFRLSGLQAAVLIAQLERLPEQIRLRAGNLDVLLNNLRVPGLKFQTAPKSANVQTLYILPGWIDEEVFGATRDEFVDAMNEEGIPCRPFYPHPLYKNPLYEKHKHRKALCPVAEEACEKCFWLPQRTLMGSETDTLDIVKAIAKIYEVYRPKSPGAKTVQ